MTPLVLYAFKRKEKTRVRTVYGINFISLKLNLVDALPWAWLEGGDDGLGSLHLHGCLLGGSCVTGVLGGRPREGGCWLPPRVGGWLPWDDRKGSSGGTGLREVDGGLQLGPGSILREADLGLPGAEADPGAKEKPPLKLGPAVPEHIVLVPSLSSVDADVVAMTIGRHVGDLLVRQDLPQHRLPTARVKPENKKLILKTI